MYIMYSFYYVANNILLDYTPRAYSKLKCLASNVHGLKTLAVFQRN